MCCTTHGLKCLHERVMSSTWSSTLCGCPFFDSLFLTLCLSVCFSYPLFFFYAELLPPCGRDNVPLALRQMRSLVPWPKTPLSQVMNPISLTTSTTQRLLKSSSRSNPATRCLKLVWRGTRRRDHRQGALLTTVHSGARRTGRPKTSLSHFWRKYVASSVIFRTLKNGETRARTQSAKFVQRKPSREMENETIRILIERQNWILLERQKRANSHWF